ncbi:MAG: hypothetical protein ABI778_06790, partial [Ignavibacteriota bacterium]
MKTSSVSLNNQSESIFNAYNLNKIIKRFSPKVNSKGRYLVLTFFLSLLFCSGVEAQSSFTPVPYNFPNQVGSSRPTNFSQETPVAPQLSTGANDKYNIIASASNGYGQWVANPQGKWMLLSNSLLDPDAVQNIPSGIIAEGYFSVGASATSEVKVVTNLKGSVRYVWPSGDRSSFVVQGFDAAQIDISFNGLPGNDSRKIIRPDIIQFSNISTVFQGVATGINSVPGFGNFDWRENWDICMDEDNLYIVWTGQDHRIYVTVAGNTNGFWPKQSP